MASFADLLTPQSKQVFDGIIAEKEEKERKERQAYWKAKEQRYISRGFKSFEALIEYIKTTGRRVYFDFCNDYGIYIQWSESKQKICHHVYENDDTDMTIGYTSQYYTEEEFIEKFKHKAAGNHINKFGYLDDFLRNDEHSIDNYKMDDRFFPMF